MDGQIMKIGELAAFFNISTKAIRIYDKKGIIKPVRVDEKTGYRYYSVDQVQRLKILLELKALGFSLKEIKRIMDGDLTGAVFIEALAKKRSVWHDVISVAENKIYATSSIMTRLSESKSTARLHEMSDEERAYLLSKLVCVEDASGYNVLSEALWL